jgi:dTDP-4-dehydrorhamnose reductase
MPRSSGSTARYTNARPAKSSPRPANSVLALGKARRLGIPLEGWRSSLRAYVTSL